ncbi:uncharacterized protein B0I36DRAFT_356690 [Microdochium trichocladiopsis]|uniref:Uncharacterized protein n=1 Tax=Microdochium trichocladiopsis TaxID=1682393 RepID=A0A9P8XRQ3_9PEZI|nr:uncharacterized protein B0I36DRAFT_356690 [Microdochium trichocladiopsis]KAH7009468.1 hypothetical protein B0I36DRAFT_356690 [Microdochium trichocladiopsis]
MVAQAYSHEEDLFQLRVNLDMPLLTRVVKARIVIAYIGLGKCLGRIKAQNLVRTLTALAFNSANSRDTSGESHHSEKVSHVGDGKAKVFRKVTGKGSRELIVSQAPRRVMSTRDRRVSTKAALDHVFPIMMGANIFTVYNTCVARVLPLARGVLSSACAHGGAGKIANPAGVTAPSLRCLRNLCSFPHSVAVLISTCK